LEQQNLRRRWVVDLMYYDNYVPKNKRHFDNMLIQFRKAENEKSLRDIEIMWIMDFAVDRQDILVALGRVERERGFHI